MRSRLRAIFFDIDDTLYSTYEFSEMARDAALEAMIKLGVRMSKERLRDELEEIVEEFSSNYEHHFDKLLLRIPRRYFKGLNHAVLVASAVGALFVLLLAAGGRLLRIEEIRWLWRRLSRRKKPQPS